MVVKTVGPLRHIVRSSCCFREGFWQNAACEIVGSLRGAEPPPGGAVWLPKRSKHNSPSSKSIYDIKHDYRKRINIHLTSLDMTKEFDGVAKLHDFNVSLWLVKIVQAFLHNHSFSIRLSLEERKEMRGGVPQGSSLSPSHILNLYGRVP